MDGNVFNSHLKVFYIMPSSQHTDIHYLVSFFLGLGAQLVLQSPPSYWWVLNLNIAVYLRSVNDLQSVFRFSSLM